MLTEQEARLAEPESAAESKLEAWRMDDFAADQRQEHRRMPNEPVSVDELRRLGVLSWHLHTGDDMQQDPQLAAIRKARGYSYQDIIEVSPSTLPEYEKKIKSFFEEHLHTDEEIRLILGGSGYFDVRGFDEQWVRIACKKGTMIVLPEGIYHRFTLDDNNYAKAMRLFVGEPVWTPLNRPQDQHPSRAKYVHDFTKATGNLSEAAVGA